MTKSEDVLETAQVTDRAEAVVISGRMIEAAAAVLVAHGVAPEVANELAGKAVGAALLAKNS